MSLAFLEYEEQFGRLWHRLVGERASLPALPRGRGGAGGRAAPAGRPVPRHGRRSGARARRRQRRRARAIACACAQRLGMSEERLLPGRAHRRAGAAAARARLPARRATLNRDLYVWLVAFLAGAEPLGAGQPTRCSATSPACARRPSAPHAVLHAFPGLRRAPRAPGRGAPELRPARRLPPAEAGGRGAGPAGSMATAPRRPDRDRRARPGAARPTSRAARLPPFCRARSGARSVPTSGRLPTSARRGRARLRRGRRRRRERHRRAPATRAGARASAATR